MLHIAFLYSLLNLSFQQNSYILPKNFQQINGNITNFDEKIQQTQIVGFGLWFKWQPLTLQDFSKTDPQCLDQFIFSLENQENEKQIQFLYLKKNDVGHKLNVLSDYFIFQEDISLGDYYEGVWVFFNSFFDFSKNLSTFYLYQSLSQQLTKFQTDQIPIFQTIIQYQIGGMITKKFEKCYSQFQGRLSILFEQYNFYESSFKNNIQNLYILINDCKQSNQNLILGSQIYDGDIYSVINLGTLEKFYFQFNGWVKIDYDLSYYVLYKIIQIINNIQENTSEIQITLQLTYFLDQQWESNNGILIKAISDAKLINKISNQSWSIKFIKLSVFQQWHFIQLDVGYPNKAGTLKFYSSKLEEVLVTQFDLIYFTGIEYGVYIGGDFNPGNYMKGTITNLVFKTFCQPSEQDFIIQCHSTCLTCFGPFQDNCLSCKTIGKRILKNDQCVCESDTFQFQNYEVCQTIDNLFTNLNILEEEIPCKLEGYDRCDDTIICSFGYFNYQEKHCIQCPYYNQMNNPNILCFNCLIDPVKFSQILTCTTDVIQYNQIEQSIYDEIVRREDNVECFRILQTKGKSYLQLIKNKILQDPPTCREGFYYENEKCNQCSFGCQQCDNSIMCQQCEDEYYLDNNKVCSKCQNCLKCKFEREQQICLSCPDKLYLKNEQCLKCGQFCANCRSNGFCNYCIDSQLYFISIDGINCLPCNIPNCKYCYQLQFDNTLKKYYASFNLYLENYITGKQILDSTVYCAKCQDEYVLDLNTNSCVKTNWHTFCLFGKFTVDKSSMQCETQKYTSETNLCNQISNCRVCLEFRCIECMKGYYFDFPKKDCKKCPIQCGNCIYQNQKLMDDWKIEIYPRYLYMKQKIQDEIQSNNKVDYEIQCTSCPPNYILYNSNCILGCNDECQQCEVIRGQAKCVECKLDNNKIIRSVDQNGQCLKCQQNCEFCQESSQEYVEQINNLFILNQENSIYTKSCFKTMPSINKKNNYINQYTVIDCEQFKKCKRKGIFTWNIYCDRKQYEDVQNKSGFFQEGNFYIDDFFIKDILTNVEIKDLIKFFNEQVIEQIDIIINFFQGKENSCKLSLFQAVISSKFIYGIFFFQGVNLTISGQQQNVLLENFNFKIQGFNSIQFENINFSNSIKINITDQLINSISFINCSLGNNSQIISIPKFNLNLINVTIESKYIGQIHSYFYFDFANKSSGKSNIQIKIEGLRIINSYFYATKFINIYADFNQQVVCEINNLEIFNSEFHQSYLFYSSASVGINDIYFGNLLITNLKIESVYLKDSTLFYIPNGVLLNIDTLIIEKIKLLQNSYFLLGNQLNCLYCYLNEVEIDQSFLFSNKVPLIYQKSFSYQIKINFNQITISQVLYTQEQSLLQIIQYNNFEMIVDINYFKITQVNPNQVELNFIQQEKSLIHMSCSQCYLNQIEIHRQNGFPEISIMDSHQIIISNSLFTQNFKQAQNIFDDCNKKIKNQFQYFIYIGQYQKVKIDNLTIIDAISLNYPFIILQGTNSMQKYFDETIEIINSKFENNKLTTSLSNSPTSIIQIKTEQKCLINLTNLQFRNNHLNMEIQDLMTHSSSTLLLDTQVGRIFMNNCLFEQNIVTNTSDSILYMKAEMVNIINSRFIKNNILNFQNLFNRIQQKSISNTINSYDLQQDIQVLSNGGSGYILTSQFSLKNCSVEESYSLYGGAFYVDTFGEAQILIENSTFEKTSSSLQSSASSAGGCFYIDAQVSKLTLLVKKSTFNQSFSRSKGGCFFILPSNSQNFVNFEQIKIINSYSTLSQFFDYSLQNLKNIFSNVTFYDIQIIYDQIAFNQFLGQLDNFSTDEATALLNNDPIIKVKYGNVTVHTVDCKSESNIFLIAIDQGQIINLIQISVENAFIRNSPFMSLNLKSGFQGLLNIQNLKMNNLQEFQEMKEIQKCKEISIKNSLQQFCISPIFISKKTILENDIEVLQQITLCQNQNLIIKSEKLKFRLIMISNINTNHKIIIQEIFLDEIICRNCENGLLSLTNIDNEKDNNIILNGIILQNLICGITGCLTIINKNSINFLKTNYIQKEIRILQQKNWEQFKLSFNFQVSLSNSKFYQNTADYGGAVFVIDIDILINQCQFFKNRAKIGGAIYSFTSQQQNYKTIIFTSFLIDNQAELAANIYLENQMLQQTKKLNIMMESNSTNLGGIIFERPRSLAVSTNQGFLVLSKKIVLSTSTKIVEKTIIEPYSILGLKEKVETLMFPSGQTVREYYYFNISTLTNIPYNLSFRIIALNMLNQEEDQLNGSVCSLKHKVINLTDSVEIYDSYARISVYSVIFNSSSLDFNLDNLIVYFNPYYDKEIVVRLFIQCEMIQIPIYDENPPFLINNYITDYELFVDIRTFPCQLGEYYNSTSKICIKCNSDQSQYQVQQNATICSIKDETKINSVESEKIELKPNFWRAYFYSTKIELCYHLLENCLGGWYLGQIMHFWSHWSFVGDGHFSTNSPYKCSNCDQIEENIITISLLSLWTLISVLISVNSTIETINQFIAENKLILFRISRILKQSSAAVLIKVFTNYLQIIQTISTFQLKVPAGLSQIFTSLGNPIEQVAYSLDCFLITISDISIIYFRIIWSFLMAISYVSTFFLLLVGGILLKQIKFNISMITTALIYIFIFLQPNIIQSLISLVSFRTLSNVAWIQGNVAYLYDTTSHQYWMISFCLPILITFSSLIPFFMFYCVRSNRYHLEQVKTRETWGYLYNEYKLKAYYWEFIKIFQKELIIIFLAYYDDYIAIKAALVFFVIFAYNFMSSSVSPYMTGELNRFDTQSTTVCAVSIILGSSIYTAQNQNFIEIVYPFYIIIAVINGWFLIKIIINIFLAYFDKLHEQVDKVKEIFSQKFPNYLRKHPEAEKLLESKKKKIERIKSRFAMIKQYLIPQAQEILKLKKVVQLNSIYNPIIKKVDQKIQSTYTMINKYSKFQKFSTKPNIYTNPDSQRELNDQQD